MGKLVTLLLVLGLGSCGAATSTHVSRGVTSGTGAGAGCVYTGGESSCTGQTFSTIILYPGQKRTLPPSSSVRQTVMCRGHGDSIELKVPRQSSTATVSRNGFDKKLSLSIAPWGSGSRSRKPRLIAICKSR